MPEGFQETYRALQRSDSRTGSIPAIFAELAIAILALCLTLWISSFAHPVAFDRSLLIDDGASQVGWPLPYASVHWIEQENGGYKQGYYNFGSLAIDVFLIYLVVNLILFTSGYVRSRSTRQVDIRAYIGEHARDRVRRLIIGVLIILVILLVISAIYSTAFTSSPQPVLPIGLES